MRRTPSLRETLVADAKRSAYFRNEGHQVATRRATAIHMVRLAVISDAYLAQVLYRIGAWAASRRIRLLPRLARAGAVAVAQVHIGPQVEVGPGLYLAHGQVTIDGPVRLEPGVVMFPWSTIIASPGAPVEVATDVRVGTGAVIEGPARIGAHVRIGANAVVTGDVPAGDRVAGVPATPVGRRTT